MEPTRAPARVGPIDTVELAGSPSAAPVSITVDHLGEALIPPMEHRLSGEALAILASFVGAAAIVLGGIAMVTSLHSHSQSPNAAAATEPTGSNAPAGAVRHSGASAGVSAAVSFLARPSTRRIPLAHSGGRIVLAVGQRGRGVLVLQGLRPASAGSSYIAWLIGPKGRILGSAGAFSGGTRIIPLSRLVPIGTGVAVTLEHAAAAAPTGKLRLVARHGAA